VAEEQLQDFARIDRVFSLLPGHIKTFHRDHLILAGVKLRMGDRAAARADIMNALKLHPFYPNSYLILATAAISPDEADRCRALANGILKGTIDEQGLK
jgi:hypothetical protein